MSTLFRFLPAVLGSLFLPTLAFAQTYITVDSDPSDAPFVLEGPNNVQYYDGVTPRQFTDLPVQRYVVHYGDVPGCITPRPQSRIASSQQPLHFFGRYDCDSVAPSPPVDPEPTPVDNLTGRAALKLSPHQMEVMPGGRVRYTLAVHNLSKTTQRNFVVSFQFDEDNMSIVDTLPFNGTVSGNGVVVWEIPVLYAGQTWSVSFPVAIDDDISQGQRLYVSARVSSPDLIADAADQLSTRVMVGTPVIPATGYRFEVLFLLLSTLCAFALALLNVRGAKA